MIRLLNIIHQDGSGHTLEIDSPITYLFDYCTMLHQQMQAGKLPINCKIHSIIPENSVVIDLTKPIDSELFTNILTDAKTLTAEQREEILKHLNFSREDFMKFFRNEDFLNSLTPDDRVEIFSHSLVGSSDFTKELLDSVLSDYCVENLQVVETNKVSDSYLIDKFLEQIQELSFEQHKKLITKYVAHSSLRQCPCCGSLFDVNHKRSTHQVNDLFGITFCSLDCSVKYTISKIPYLKVEHKDVLNELIERLEEEYIPKEVISEHFKM